MYYLEGLTIKDIVFMNELIEEYHHNNFIKSGVELPGKYHSLKTKVDRLKRFVKFNPNEQETPKKDSKWSQNMIKKRIIINGVTNGVTNGVIRNETKKGD